MRPSREREASPDSPTDSLKALAQCFMLVPDMSATDDMINLLDPLNSPHPSVFDHPTPDTIRCLCDSSHIADTMLQCDSCKLWMHGDCLHVTNSGDGSPFICLYCQQKISNAIRGYVRAQLQRLRPTDMETDLSDFWADTLRVIEEVKDLLQAVPKFLPHPL
jgi:hypothetical protein